jgi:hypothetical protein
LAEQYNVSSRTIERDARVAEAISAIGESSPVCRTGRPEAKRNILSGATGISRRRLQELATGPQEDLEEIATSIEDGTFDLSADRQGRVRVATPDKGGPEAPVHDVMELLNTAIAKMADYFNTQQPASGDDAAGLRARLRSHIDMLEDLYRQI